VAEVIVVAVVMVVVMVVTAITVAMVLASNTMACIEAPSLPTVPVTEQSKAYGVAK
jgi:hypothetical protein